MNATTTAPATTETITVAANTTLIVAYRQQTDLINFICMCLFLKMETARFLHAIMPQQQQQLSALNILPKNLLSIFIVCPVES